jgi:hypothetical protein
MNMLGCFGSSRECGAQRWLADFFVERHHAAIFARAEPFLTLGAEA